MEPLKTVRVFVSSPARGLKAEREAVLQRLRGVPECLPVGMEDFGAEAEPPLAVSLEKLGACQAVVLFYGATYGSGITEQEYDEAQRLGLPCFVYLPHPDRLPKDLEEREPRLVAFRRKVSGNGIYDTYSSPDELGGKAGVKISTWLHRPGSVPPRSAADLERLADDMSRDLAREEAEPLGLDPDAGLPPLSTEEELLATSVREHLRGAQEKTLGDLLGSRTLNRFVLLGEPGAGKTSLLKQIALRDLRLLREGDAEARLPVYVRLIWYAGETSLEELVVQSVQGFAPDIEAAQVRRWLSEGQVRVLLDGLNEVAVEDGRRCRAEILQFMGRYPRSGFVVTDRPTYDGALPAPAFRLQDWDFARIRGYIEKAVRRLASPRSPERLLERIECDPRLGSVVSSPLPLGILTSLYGETGRIAANRGELYRSFVERLLERERGRAGSPLHGTARLLRSLAFEAVRRGLTRLPESLVLGHVGECLRTWQDRRELADELTARDFLDRFRQGRWLLGGPTASLQFRYTALQEYFAAAELLDRWEREEPLDAAIADARFEEPVVLVASLLGPRAGSFLHQVHRVAGVQLAAKCLIGVGEDVAGRDRILRHLVRELSSQAERRRSSAAAKFIFLRAPEAIPALAEALADESGAVRWNASLAIERTLERSQADRFFADVLSRPGHPSSLKRTACQALGRSGSPAAVEALIRALHDAEEEVRAEAARALSRVLQPASLRLLETAARGGADERIQAGALRTLALAGADSAAGLARSCLDHPSPRVRREARIALGRLGDREVVAGAVRRATGEGEIEGRVEAIQELEDMGANAQEAVEPLWDLLEVQELQFPLVQAFQAFGGTTALELAARDLADPEPARRRTAVKVLRYLRDDRAVEQLARALRDPDDTVANAASVCFKAFSDRAVPVLQAALEEARDTDNERWQRAVLLTLKELGTRMSLQLLIEAVDDPAMEETARKYLKSYLGNAETDPEQVRLILRERLPGAGDARAGQLRSLLETAQLQYDLRLALDIRNGADTEAWNELVEETRSDLPALRGPACAALGETRDPRAEPILRRLILEDPHSGVRAYAITALVRLDPEADPALVAELARLAGDPAEASAVRRASLRALGAFGGPAERELLARIAREEPALAQPAALSLTEIAARQRGDLPPGPEPPEWMPVLLGEALRSHHRRERRMAAEAMPGLALPTDRKIAGLGSLLKDPDVQVRRAAILGLRQIGTAAALQRLGTLVEDTQPVLRELAVDTLAARVETPEAYRTLARFLADSNPGIRRRTVQGLSTLPSEALTEEHARVVRGCLFADDPWVRGGMLEALPGPLLERHRPRLERLMADRHAYPRAMAARAVARMSTPEAYELLARAARDAHLSVVDEVLAALPSAPDGSAGPLLTALLTHRMEEVRLRALDQVEKTGPDARAGEALVEAINDRRQAYRHVQWRAIEVAGRLRARAAAPLLAELSGSTASPLRTRAAEALRQIGTADVVPLLLAHLPTDNFAIRSTIIPLLGASGSPAAVPALSAELTSRESAVRTAAVHALAELGDPAVAGPLARLADRSRDPREREEALAALSRLETPEATAALLHAADRRDGRALELLWEHAAVLPAPRLVDLLAAPLPAARAIGARRLGRRREETAVPALAGLLLRDAVPEARSAAAEALAEIGSPESLEALRPAFSSHDPGILLPALRAVSAQRWEDPQIAGRLLALLRRADAEDPEVLRAVEEALVPGGVSRRLPELGELLRLEQPREVRRAACRVLESLMGEEDPGAGGEWGDPQLSRQLVAVLRRAVQVEPEVLRVAEQALVRSGAPGVRGELLELLRHATPHVRQAASRVLGGVRAEEAVQPLLGLLDDENPYTRQEAVEALRRIGTEEVADRLLPVLQERDWRLRATAVRALGEMGVEEAAGAVGEVLLQDPSSEVRRAAAGALGRIRTSQAVEMLGLAAFDESPDVRDAALQGLAGVPADSAAARAATDGLRLLLEDGYQPRRLGAVRALAAAGTPRAVEGLLQAIQDPHPDIRQLSIRALGQLRAGQALEVLEDATLDPVPAVARTAHEALNGVREELLGKALELATRPSKEFVYNWRQTKERIQPLLHQLGPEWIARALLARLAPARPGRGRTARGGEENQVRLLGWIARSLSREDLLRDVGAAILHAAASERKPVRIAGVIAIGDAGLEHAVPTVLGFARSRDSHEQQAAARALVELKVRESVPVLRSLAAPGQPIYTRHAALLAFEEINDYEARPEALDALGDPHGKVRLAAIIALGKIGQPEDVSALLEYLHDPEPELRRAASISLRKLKADSLASEFVALLKDPNARVAETAIRACRELKIGGAVEPLIDLVLSGPGGLREAAAEALVTLESPLTLRYLAPLVASDAPLLARRALGMLARLDLPDARQALAAALASPDPELRLAAVRSVSGKPEQARWLGPAKALEDPDPRVRRAAVSLVAGCDLVQLFQPDLAGLLADPDPGVRAEVAAALGQDGGSRSVAPLIAATEKETEGGVQTAMLRALVRLGTPAASARLERWRSSGTPRERFRVVAAIQAERLREIVEETTSRSPAERLDDPNPYIQSAAIRQIGQQGRAEEAPRLLAFLSSRNPFLCQAAVIALSQLGERSALPAIRGLARPEESSNPWTRAQAAEALGRFRDPESLPILGGLLEDRASYVRQAAAEAVLAVDSPASREIAGRLLESGEPPLAMHVAEHLGKREAAWTPVLLRGLAHPDDEVRIRVLQQLARTEPGVAELEGLRDVLGSPSSPRVLREALRTVARSGARILALRVAHFLTHRDSFLRAEAARTLGELGERRFSRELARLTRDVEPHVVVAATRALGALRAADAVPVLGELLGSEDRAMADAAIHALTSVGTPEAFKTLGQALSHPGAELREEAVRALQGAPAEVALPLLAAAVRDDNAFVREKAAAVLSTWDGREEAVEALAGALRDPNPYVRLAAVNSLVRLRSVAALSQLEGALSDPSPHVRVRAVWGLGRLPDEDIQEQIVAALQDANSHVRAAAVSVLDRRSGGSWLAALADLVRDEPIQAVRSLALHALKRAAGSGGQAYLLGLEREREEQERALQAPQTRELAQTLAAWGQGRCDLQDEGERGRLISGLGQAFSSGLIPLRLAAGRLLAALPAHPEVLPIYEYAVQDPLPDVRKDGLRALVRLGTPDALQLLQTTMANEESADVRGDLISEAETLADEEVALRVLQLGLADRGRSVVQRALRVLTVRRFADAASLAGPLLGHGDDFIREAAVNTLARLRAVEAVPEIRRLVGDPSWYVRQDAVKALAELGGDSEVTLEACQRGLEDPNLYVQLTSVQALRDLGSPAAAPLLLEQLRHPHAAIRGTAVRGLAACLRAPWKQPPGGPDRDEIGGLLPGFFDAERDSQVRSDFVEALAAWDLPRATRFLQDFLLDPDAIVRRKVLAVCERGAGHLDLERILARLETAGDEVTVWSRRDLGSLVRSADPHRFLPLLLRLAADDDEFVRANAIYALGGLDDPEALRVLAAAQADPSPRVQEIARHILPRIFPSSPPASPPKADWPEEDGSGGEDPAVRLRETLELVRREDTGEDARESLATLVSKVESSNWIDRWYAVILLAEQGADALDVLFRVWVKETNATVRQEVDRSLKRLPPDLVGSAASGFLQQHERELSSEAADSLTRFVRDSRAVS